MLGFGFVFVMQIQWQVDYWIMIQGPQKVAQCNCPYQHPLIQFGTQQRSFNKSWFEQFKWLEYSVSKNCTF